jgi:RecA/RadA recombinase
VRDNIGVMFGRKWTRNGGRALDFYTSQILVLSQTGTIEKTISGITRTTGIKVKAKVDKNKISLNYREADFPIRFGYGIDDDKSMTDWLTAIKTSTKHTTREQLQALVQKRWYQIETEFAAKEKKYT